MAISVVATGWGVETATSPAIDSSGSNLLLVQIALGAAAYTATSDSKTNPYTNTTKYGGTSSFHGWHAYCAEADIVAVGSSHTATNALGYQRIGLIAVSGAAAAPFYQESGNDAASSTSIQPGSITPSEDGCLLVSTLNGYGGGVITPPSGWTVVGNETGGAAVAYLIQSTAAAVNPTWATASATHLVATMTVWKPAAGGGDTTAPTLSSPTGTGGTGTCSGTVSTDEGNGTLYAVATASATAPSAAQVKAGQDHTGSAALRVVSQAVSATGVQTVASGACSAGTRYLHYMHEDAAANQSTVSSSASFTVSAPDTTAPTLSSPTSSATGKTTGTGGVTTDEANGTLYAVATTSATAPSGAQVRAGQDHTGAAAAWAGSQAIASTGAKTANATGLTAGGTYYFHFQHRDAASNDSTVSSSAAFTTHLYGFDLDDAANALEFGNVSGSLVDLALATSVALDVTVHDPDAPATVLASTTATTNGTTGRLARFTDADLNGQPYLLVFQTTEVDPADRKVAAIIMDATLP